MKEESKYKFCPTCTQPLSRKLHAGVERLLCTNERCGFVLWENPVPVVAAIVECEGQVLLVRSIGWPEGWFALVTGFLEKNEDPAAAVVRELKEETGLEAVQATFIGHYPFHRLNQLLIVYHVLASPGEVVLDRSELEDYRWVPIEKVQPWDRGTGLALRDWLKSRGFDREVIPLFPRPVTD